MLLIVKKKEEFNYLLKPVKEKLREAKIEDNKIFNWKQFEKAQKDFNFLNIKHKLLF